MKDQLQKWKKERLVKVNKDPPSNIRIVGNVSRGLIFVYIANDKQVTVTKDSSMRQKDVVKMKARTIK